MYQSVPKSLSYVQGVHKPQQEAHCPGPMNSKIALKQTRSFDKEANCRLKSLGA